MGTARRAQPKLRQRHASVPPLPPTLDVEGADQPAWWKIVAAHASIGRRARSSFIAAEGYTAGLPVLDLVLCPRVQRVVHGQLEGQLVLVVEAEEREPVGDRLEPA